MKNEELLKVAVNAELTEVTDAMGKEAARVAIEWQRKGGNILAYERKLRKSQRRAKIVIKEMIDGRVLGFVFDSKYGPEVECALHVHKRIATFKFRYQI